MKFYEKKNIDKFLVCMNRIIQVLITELKTISDILFSNTTRYARHNSLVDLLATKSHFFVSRDKRDLLWKHIATARLFPQTKHFDDLIFQVFNLSLRTLSWVSPLLMICFVNNTLKKMFWNEQILDMWEHKYCYRETIS